MEIRAHGADLFALTKRIPTPAKLIPLSLDGAQVEGRRGPEVCQDYIGRRFLQDWAGHMHTGPEKAVTRQQYEAAVRMGGYLRELANSCQWSFSSS